MDEEKSTNRRKPSKDYSLHSIVNTGQKSSNSNSDFPDKYFAIELIWHSISLFLNKIGILFGSHRRIFNFPNIE